MNNEFKNDMEVLSTHSDFARKYACNGFSIGFVDYNAKDLLTVFNWYNDGPQPEDGFHPSNAGCIKLDDDYMFDFRCNHLIWIDYYDVNDPKTLLIGNHKGYTDFRVITYNLKN